MSERHRSLGGGSWMRYVIIMIAAFLIYTLGSLDNESIKLHAFLGASEIERKSAVQNQPIEKLPEKNWSMTATHNQSVPHKTVNIPLGEVEYNSSENTTNSITAYERLHPSLECLPLPEPRNLTHPVSVGACCGIGHRLCFNLPTFVWAVQHGYPVSAVWPDVPWSVLFKDFIGIKASTERADEHYDNGYPGHWLEGIPDYPKATMPKPGTSYAQYSNHFPLLFDMPLAQSIVRMLQCNLNVTVLSFLKSVREQSLRSELHLCAHIREGNNETGDWAGKTWRHIDLYHTLNSTLNSMRDMAKLKNTNNVTVFIASDSPNARPWFEKYVESSWTVIRPAKEIKKPESGVWFGEWNSKTNSVLNQEQKNEAMAEAVSDIFALGECDALWIPNYSSFTLISIILTRANRRPVKFMHFDTAEFVELPLPNNATEEAEQPSAAQTENSIVTDENQVDQPQLATVCTSPTCRQSDPRGAPRLAENHRGLSLLLRNWKDCTANAQCNLAYIMIPQSGSTASKHAMIKNGRTENVWLSPTDGANSTNYDPYIFSLIRHPGERIASAYSAIVSRYNGNYGSFNNSPLLFPTAPEVSNKTLWLQHFKDSIHAMLTSVNEHGWNNSQAVWNVHIVPQVEFMRGLNVSHIGCVNSINKTFEMLHLNSDGAPANTYEHKRTNNMPDEKFASYDLIDDKVKELVTRLYADDYILYQNNC